MPGKHLINGCGGGGGGGDDIYYVIYSEMISQQISSDSFPLKKSIGKNKEIILEKLLLSWEQTEELSYLNLF